jgi:hypothetical protein
MNKSKNAHRADGAHPERSSRRRSRWTADQAEGWNLRFESAGTAVPAGLLKQSPMLLVAAAEDMCWQAAAEDWRARRPHRWQRHAFAAWRAQSGWLEQKRRRLCSMVEDALAAH